MKRPITLKAGVFFVPAKGDGWIEIIEVGEHYVWLEDVTPEGVVNDRFDVEDIVAVIGAGVWVPARGQDMARAVVVIDHAARELKDADERYAQLRQAAKRGDWASRWVA